MPSFLGNGLDENPPQGVTPSFQPTPPVVTSFSVTPTAPSQGGTPLPVSVQGVGFEDGGRHVTDVVLIDRNNVILSSPVTSSGPNNASAVFPYTPGGSFRVGVRCSDGAQGYISGLLIPTFVDNLSGPREIEPQVWSAGGGDEVVIYGDGFKIGSVTIGRPSVSVVGVAVSEQRIEFISPAKPPRAADCAQISITFPDGSTAFSTTIVCYV